MTIPERKEEAEENPQVNHHSENEEKDGSSEDDPSPRGVLEVQNTVSDSDYVLRNTLSLEKAWENIDYSMVQWRSKIEMFRKKSVRKFSSTIPLITASYELSRKSLKKKILARIRSTEASIEGAEKPRWKNFEYAELAAVTNGFSRESLIGEGGHAEVYKGHLDGEVVAIKKLVNYGKDDEQMANDFLSELGIIAHVNHPNTARLIGFAVDRGLYFVLQYAPHGSLSSWLFGSSKNPYLAGLYIQFFRT